MHISVMMAIIATPASAASYCAASGWTQVFADEFDAAELNGSVWAKDVGPPGDSRTRAAAATADSVWLEDGALVIQTNGTWDGAKWTNLSSGAVQSMGKRSWQGKTRVCVSAKLPGGPVGHGAGIWPAHWMMPDDESCWPCHGEIDIMEMINGDGDLHGTYHFCLNSTCGEPQHKQHSGTTTMPSDWWQVWHEYSVEYDGVSDVIFAVDGVEYVRTTSAEALLWPTPYYMILNTAVGDGSTWPRAPDADTIFPTRHYVDYVRVSQPALGVSTGGRLR